MNKVKKIEKRKPLKINIIPYFTGGFNFKSKTLVKKKQQKNSTFF